MAPLHARGDQEGFTLIEALLVVGIFSIIALALAGMFQTARTGFDVAATQAFVQRTGTAVEKRRSVPLLRSFRRTPARSTSLQLHLTRKSFA